jgi:hypothetical protein
MVEQPQLKSNTLQENGVLDSAEKWMLKGQLWMPTAF